MKTRGFEIVSKYKNENLELPRRATKHAAGYDLSVAESICKQEKFCISMIAHQTRVKKV